MEPWQKNYVRDNLANLLELTICNVMLFAELQSEKMLSHEDVQRINASPCQMDKAGLLYEILGIKTNAYWTLAKALAKGGHSGAYDILCKGYAHYLSPTININFLGSTQPLSSYLGEGEIQEVIKEAKQHLSSRSFLNIFENPYAENDTIALIGSNDQSPPAPNYIDRMLYKRLVVNREIFQKKCPDTFIFKDINLSQLTKMVKPEIVAYSGSQLLELTSRFILLENDNDWEVILTTAAVPVHLIKYEQQTKTCLLQQTTGVSTIINQHLDCPQKDDIINTCLTEDKFIDKIINGPEAGVCICDSPGMGKTLLLANLVTKIAAQHPERLVSFVSLSKLVAHLTRAGEPPNVLHTTFCRNALLDYLSTGPLALSILDKILTNVEIPLELFFDGFDEVPTKYIPLVQNFIGELSRNFLNTRVYVTSRPHMRQQLEAALRVISYDILPFTETNQLNFLISFWKNKNTQNDDEKLWTFAKLCLEKVQNAVTREERNITGNPLLCHLLANVYSKSANIYSRPNSAALFEESCKFGSSLTELYREYVKQSYAKIQSDFVLEIKQYHVWVAFKTIFPEAQAPFSEKFASEAALKFIVEKSVSMGILGRQYVKRGETVEFVHRTFAEYFVSEFLYEWLEHPHLPFEHFKSESDENIAKLFLEDALMTKNTDEVNEDVERIFVYSVIVYFLNFLLEKLKLPLERYILPKQFLISVPPKRLHTVIVGCARENYANIFKFITAIFLRVEKHAGDILKNEMFAEWNTQKAVCLINVAAMYSTFAFLDKLFSFFREHLGYDLDSVCEKMPVDMDTPLHFAIERAEVQSVQYFAQRISLRSRNLLLSCVLESNEEAPQIVKRKVEICKYLLDKCPEIYSEATYTLYDSVHVDLIKALIKAGTDPLATKSDETVVHYGARCMSPSNFHQLCQFLIEDRKATHLFKSNKLRWRQVVIEILLQQKFYPAHISEKQVERASWMTEEKFYKFCRSFVEKSKPADLTKLVGPKWKCPLPYIFSRQKKMTPETIQLILSIPGIDPNERFGQGNTLFLLAVKQVHNNDITLALAASGANVNAVNFSAENALHLAAKANNVQIIPLLIKFGVDCRHCDFGGNSFLHNLGAGKSTPEEYHEIVSLLSSTNQADIFHIRNKYDRLPLHVAVYRQDVKVETLQIFHHHNVDFNSVDKWDWSPAKYAAIAGRSVEFRMVLIQINKHVLTHVSGGSGGTFLHSTSIFLNPEQYHKLLEFLVCQRQEIAFTKVDKNGRNPFHLAVFHKELLPETLQLIYKEFWKRDKFNINTTDNHNVSALMHASKGGRSVAFLKTILDMGADVMIQDMDGNNFAHIVSEIYSSEEYHTFMELLVSRGHEQIFQVANANLMTPLHFAFLHVELHQATLNLIDEKLVKTGAVDINFTDKWGRSILMFAVFCSHPMYISTSSPLAKLSWSNPENGFLTCRSIEGVCKGNMPYGKWKVDHFRTLIEMGANVMLQTKAGVYGRGTFAHYVSYHHSPEQYHELVELLVQTGNTGVFQVVDENGYTPLHMAILTFDLLDTTLDLINDSIFQTGIVDINYRAKHGRSFLCFAVMGERSVKFLEKLIKVGVDPTIVDKHGSTFAHYVPKHYTLEQYKEIVKMLVGTGNANVFHIENGIGHTPLSAAVVKLELPDATLDLINELLFQTRIVNINVTDKFGCSLLVYAAKGERSVKFLEKLIKLGVDPSIQDEHGNNVAYYSALHYNPHDYHKIVQLLMSTDQGKIFQTANHYGGDAISAAVWNLELHLETLDLFAAFYMSLRLNSMGNEGNFILHWAVRGKRSLQFVKHLVSLGADWSVEDGKKSSLAHNCAFCGLTEHVKYFVELGCNVNAVDDAGNNVLQNAMNIARENSYEMVNFLLEKGADKQNMNKDNQTAYYIAIRNGITDPRILDLLK